MITDGCRVSRAERSVRANRMEDHEGHGRIAGRCLDRAQTRATASRRLAHGFRASLKPKRENRNVRYPSVELDWGGRKLVLETGKVARQADGAVVATYGETKVLATVVAAKTPREGVDFLPLTVDYQEKYYAAGRIPGGYFKREGRPTEKETLVSRLIDRPIRPLFADGWRNETQVIVTTLSHDLENDPDILALVASSAALTLSGAPFMGPIGAARVGFFNNEYILNPTLEEMAESQLDLVVAGTGGRGADGRVGSQGASRGDHARRGDVRSSPFPAGDRGDHRARREGRQGAARAQGRRQRRARKGNARHRRERSARRLCGRRQDGAPQGGRRRQGEGHGALFPRRQGARLTTSCASAACSRSSKPRSCAGTSSTPASASTAAT